MAGHFSLSLFCFATSAAFVLTILCFPSLAFSAVLRPVANSLFGSPDLLNAARWIPLLADLVSNVLSLSYHCTATSSVRALISCNLFDRSLSLIPTTNLSLMFSFLLAPKSQFSDNSYSARINVSAFSPGLWVR